MYQLVSQIVSNQVVIHEKKNKEKYRQNEMKTCHYCILEGYFIKISALNPVYAANQKVKISLHSRLM